MNRVGRCASGNVWVAASGRSTNGAAAQATRLRAKRRSAFRRERRRLHVRHRSIADCARPKSAASEAGRSGKDRFAPLRRRTKQRKGSVGNTGVPFEIVLRLHSPRCKTAPVPGEALRPSLGGLAGLEREVRNVKQPGHRWFTRRAFNFPRAAISRPRVHQHSSDALGRAALMA